MRGETASAIVRISIECEKRERSNWPEEPRGRNRASASSARARVATRRGECARAAISSGDGQAETRDARDARRARAPRVPRPAGGFIIVVPPALSYNPRATGCGDARASSFARGAARTYLLGVHRFFLGGHVTVLNSSRAARGQSVPEGRCCGALSTCGKSTAAPDRGFSRRRAGDVGNFNPKRRVRRSRVARRVKIGKRVEFLRAPSRFRPSHSSRRAPCRPTTKFAVGR